MRDSETKNTVEHEKSIAHFFSVICSFFGAGEGNRTLDASLGSSNFTIKLHLQIDIEIMYVIILRMAELVK